METANIEKAESLASQSIHQQIQMLLIQKIFPECVLHSGNFSKLFTSEERYNCHYLQDAERNLPKQP